MSSKNTRVVVIAGVVAAGVIMVLAVVGMLALQEQKNDHAVPAPPASFGKNSTLQTSSTLRLSQTIPLSGVKGRIDHRDVDIPNQRLFIAAAGNDSVEIVDLKSDKAIHRITTLQEPQGVLFVPEYKRLFVSNGGDGSVQVFDSDSFRLVQTAKFPDDADNMRYEASEKVVYVGYGSGGLGLINATDGRVVANIPLDGHPESFQLSKTAGGMADKIYANIPVSNTIAIIDAQGKSVVSKWKIGPGGANYPMALDAGNHTLFVGVRSPPKLVVYDTNTTTTNQEIAQINIAQDPDDIFVDQRSSKIYVSCGAGFVDIIEENGKGDYFLSEQVSTASGARTSLFVQSENRLYVAASESAGRPAQILVFDT